MKKLSILLVPAVLLVAPLTTSADQSATPTDQDPLANITVTLSANGRPLPKLAMIPSLSADLEDVTLNSVVKRDLDLSGEFEIMGDSATPDNAYVDPPDVKGWQAKGAEDLVRVSARKINDKEAELRGQAFVVASGSDPIYDKKFTVPLSDVRIESHRLADLLIGAFTGFNGSFASHMTFALGTGNVRQVFRMDADGFDATAVSPAGRVALAPTYGPNDELYYSASVNKGLYKVYTANAGPLSLNVDGSVYGIAFNKDRSKVAVTIGQGSEINLFVGPSLTELQPGPKAAMVLRPGFTPTGKLLYAGEGKFGNERIFVDDKPISPEGIFATSPTFCKSPDGNRIVFAAGASKQTDLVITGEAGGDLGRLTQGAGSNSYPACSPDGRLVAFFSTRTGGEGPGLYIMRIDGGGRAKRVSSLVGDSLRWDPYPPGKISDPNAGQAKKSVEKK